MKTCMTALILIALFAVVPCASAADNAPVTSSSALASASGSAAPVAMPSVAPTPQNPDLPSWLTGQVLFIWLPETMSPFEWKEYQGGPNCMAACKVCILELGEPCCKVSYDLCACC
jgi:hypothetical protein